MKSNQYAALNPGHTFILETRDKTRYLTINQVNALTPADILPSSSAATGTCGGVEDLRPDDFILDDGEVPVSTGGTGGSGTPGGRPGGTGGSGTPGGGRGGNNTGAGGTLVMVMSVELLATLVTVAVEAVLVVLEEETLLVLE